MLPSTIFAARKREESARLFALSIDTIWHMAGPAVAVGAIRGCADCYRPIESVTANRGICNPCLIVRAGNVAREPCVSCGRQCVGKQCKECCVKPKSCAVHFEDCGNCGTKFTFHGPRKRYCSDRCRVEANRTAARNQYRDRVGIPTDAPLRKAGRPRNLD